MRVLLDTDVLLDVILARAPFIQPAAALLDLSEQGVFEAYVCAITPLNICYIARTAQSSSGLKQAIADLLRKTHVCPLDHAILVNALSSPINDYEDAVQHACAVADGLDAIVTRNVKDYKNATLPVFTPTDFLNQLRPQQP